MSTNAALAAKYIRLYKGNLIPLRTILSSLTWVLHDYFVTLEDEVTYVWSMKRSFGKFMFLWIRYYTVFLLVFDVVQIHTFAIPGVTSNTLCVAIDPITRMAGAISLWSVEIVMQVRIYALFDRNKKIALVNGILFLCSIASFLYIMTVGAIRRGKLIASAIHLPLPGCPAINGGIGWSLWIPATGFELVLFALVVYRSGRVLAAKAQLRRKQTLSGVLIHDNILYFFGVSALLVFNNVMASGITKIPWFSFGPFHAAIGIMTTRMLMNLRKTALRDGENEVSGLTHAHAAPSVRSEFVAAKPDKDRRPIFIRSTVTGSGNTNDSDMAQYATAPSDSVGVSSVTSDFELNSRSSGRV